MSIAEQIKNDLQSLVPILKERAAEAEKLERIHDESIEAIINTGFLKVLQPSAFGGYELEFGDFLEMVSIIGKGCASTGWVAGTAGSQSWFLSLMSEQAQKDVWEDDPDALLTSSWAPDGIATIVSGGYELTGNWRFCSGSDFAAWSVFGANVIDQKNDKDSNNFFDRGYFLVPNTDYEITGGWNVSSLAATGSHNAEIKKSFIPQHRFASAEGLVNGTSPGSKIHSAAIYKMPLLACSPFAIIAPLVGAAEAMLDDFIENMRDRTTSGSDNNIANEPIIQEHAARAAAIIDAVKLIIARDVAEAMETINTGKTLSKKQRLQLRRSHGFTARLLSEAAEILFAATGGKGLYLDNHLQRGFRDIKGGVNHITSSWDIAGPMWGAHAFGLEPKIPMY